MGPQHNAPGISTGLSQPTISYYDTSKIMQATERGFRQMSIEESQRKCDAKSKFHSLQWHLLPTEHEQQEFRRWNAVVIVILGLLCSVCCLRQSALTLEQRPPPPARPHDSRDRSSSRISSRVEGCSSCADSAPDFSGRPLRPDRGMYS